jgi:hypothetical protein
MSPGVEAAIGTGAGPTGWPAELGPFFVCARGDERRYPHPGVDVPAHKNEASDEGLPDPKPGPTPGSGSHRRRRDGRGAATGIASAGGDARVMARA